MTVATRCCSFIRDEKIVIVSRGFAVFKVGSSFNDLGRIIEVGVTGVGLER